jgi:hypothetical protein
MNENEEQAKLSRAYRRAGIGLAIGALIWTVALLTGKGLEGGPFVWIIPVAAAVLSALCLRKRSSI